jgi:hypothetical protein
VGPAGGRSDDPKVLKVPKMLKARMSRVQQVTEARKCRAAKTCSRLKGCPVRIRPDLSSFCAGGDHTVPG